MIDQQLRTPLSEMQGQLFEMSGNYGYDSETFIKVFMKSKLAKGLDSDFDFLQWAGKEYIFERFTDEYKDKLKLGGTIYHNEVLYWTGYVYRYWHFYNGMSSKEIVKVANPKTMNTCFLGFHTLDVEFAIDRLMGK